MKKRILILSQITLAFLAAVAIILTACIPQNTKDTIGPPSFDMKMTKELPNFKNPECVLYDPATKMWYVSNVNGHPGAADGNGSISGIGADLTPESIAHDWVTGLNAPKGLAVYNGKLYVTDLGEIVEIDIATRNITKHAAPGATFLNDLAVDASGNIYASNTWGMKDFGDTTATATYNRKIYVLAQGAAEATEWLANDDLNAPNGLFIEGDFMYVCTWGNGLNSQTFASMEPGKILKIDMKTKAIEVIAENLGNLDGIVRYGAGYIVSDYLKGSILYVDDATKTSKVLAEGLGMGVADFGVNVEGKELVYPLNGGTTVVRLQIQ